MVLVLRFAVPLQPLALFLHPFALQPYPPTLALVQDLPNLPVDYVSKVLQNSFKEVRSCYVLWFRINHPLNRKGRNHDRDALQIEVGGVQVGA